MLTAWSGVDWDPIVSFPTLTTNTWRCLSRVTCWSYYLLSFDFFSVGNVDIIIVISMSTSEWNSGLGERPGQDVNKCGGVFSECICEKWLRVNKVASGRPNTGLTVSCDQVSIDSHKVWFLQLEHISHDNQTLTVLLRTPVIPWVLSEMEIAENGEFERSIFSKNQTRFSRIWVEDVSFLNEWGLYWG